ncbi:AMP-binding protein [Nocardiopsis sp. RSe5-2]|uniref:AMP-binding protein n=1 Tax=Nocardiopsis endophytica TaxID=3018445 RepID=A0ABT4U6U0_9ACTN|nr:AMP-binding protein [Nocardiopsis endophytica]MDA2812067.1 AMP-binding protein [Nocardiopsis endophytica]
MRDLPAHGTPAGSLTEGLLERLQSSARTPAVTAAGGARTPAIVFAATAERAAAGLARRGVHPGDVVAVLVPPSPERLLAVFTALAAGAVVLPLEGADPAAAEVLTSTDTRMLLVSEALASDALALADRSRVRQVVAFGQAPETTPFDELLLPGPEGADPDRAAGEAGGGLLTYRADARSVRTAVHGQEELLDRFRALDAQLALTPEDTVALDAAMPEPEQVVLAAVALWSGASVVASPGAPPSELAALGVTVQGSPAPARIG